MDLRHSSQQPRAEHFIEAARTKHGHVYDYTKVVATYVNVRTPVQIVCREHGPFWQLPHEHVKGAGCPDCGRRRGSSVEARAAAFIDVARQRHGARYNYDSASFTGMRFPVRIQCLRPEHGWFEQRATNHTRGQGCPSCARDGR
jgi:hypothetical protein